jgi:hypothetical protein
VARADAQDAVEVDGQLGTRGDPEPGDVDLLRPEHPLPEPERRRGLVDGALVVDPVHEAFCLRDVVRLVVHIDEHRLPAFLPRI